MGKLFDNKILALTFSLALSMLLWLYVGVQNPETDQDYRDIDIKIIMKNSQMENAVTPIGTGGEKVTITLRGNRNVLNRIEAADIYATLEIDASLPAGSHYFPVNVTLPVDNVIITGRHPAGFDVRLDKMVTAIIPVTVDMTSSLPNDIYTLKDPIVKPETIEIRGPETEISLVKEAKVKINITEKNMMESTFNVAYVLYDNSDEQINSGYIESAVRTITVEPIVLEKKTLPVKIGFTNLPEGWLSTDFAYTISPATLDLFVPINEARSIEYYNAGEIDLSKYAENRAVELLVDEMFTTTDGVKKIKVNLKFGKMKYTDVEVENVIFDNLPEGMSAKIVSELPLEIQCRGKGEVLDAFQPENIKAVVDLLGITSVGTVALPVKIITGNSEVGVYGNLTAMVEIE